MPREIERLIKRSEYAGNEHDHNDMYSRCTINGKFRSEVPEMRKGAAMQRRSHEKEN